MDASTLTDPDCLGPCEPGTSVVLEGLVWAESNNGIYSQPVILRGCQSRARPRYALQSVCPLSPVLDYNSRMENLTKFIFGRGNFVEICPRSLA